MNKFKPFVFPLIMLLLGFATVARYSAIQSFRSKSKDHPMVVETGDIEAVERALRGATFQPIEMELISGDRYRIVVRCPPDKIGYISSLIHRMGARQADESVQ